MNVTDVLPGGFSIDTWFFRRAATAGLLWIMCLSTLFAFEDPISVSLTGTNVSELPDFVVVGSSAPNLGAKALLNSGGTLDLSLSGAANPQVVRVDRHGVQYTFATLALVRETIGVDGWKGSDVTIYGFVLGDGEHLTEFCEDQKLTNDKRLAACPSGVLFKENEGFLVWVVTETEMLACPMHPDLIVGDKERCAICEMPKVIRSQIPAKEKRMGKSNGSRFFNEKQSNESNQTGQASLMSPKDESDGR